MASFKSIEEIKVWQESMNLVSKIYRISTLDYVLRDQMRRASISIPSNIAEGFERKSQNEFRRFLYIAKGSCGELRTQLILAKNLKFLSNEKYDILYDICLKI